jgi:hypothetical protein
MKSKYLNQKYRPYFKEDMVSADIDARPERPVDIENDTPDSLISNEDEKISEATKAIALLAYHTLTRTSLKEAAKRHNIPLPKLKEDMLGTIKDKVLSWLEEYLNDSDSFLKDVTNMLLQKINIKIEY